MKFNLCIGTFSLALFLQICLSESDKDTQTNYERERSSALDVAEGPRADVCIDRFRDCTKNKHGCSRGKIFKDICECVILVNGKEKCQCEQPWYHKIIEDLVGEVPYLPPGATVGCIPKYHDCTGNKTKCCDDKLGMKYTCRCYDIIKDDGTKDEQCGCVSPLEHEALVAAVRFVKKVFF